MDIIPNSLAFWRSDTKKNLLNFLAGAKVYYGQSDFEQVKGYIKSIESEADRKHTKEKTQDWQNIADAARDGLKAFSMLNGQKINMSTFQADLQIAFEKIGKAIAKVR